MRLEDVPRKIAVVGSPTSDAAQLADNIAYIIGELAHITHWEPIHGAAWSGRVLYLEMAGEAVDFPSPMDPIMMAEELLLLSEEGSARYPPDELPGQKKGWLIYQAQINGKKAIIAWATWADA